MSGNAIDIEKLRVALRRMSRGDLLVVAERSIEMMPRTKLRHLLGDMVRLDELSEGTRGRASLLYEVQAFHDASLRGEYFQSFDVNGKNFMEKSKGTDAFIAEFGRLTGKCIRAAAKGSRPAACEAFQLLFAPWRMPCRATRIVVLSMRPRR